MPWSVVLALAFGGYLTAAILALRHAGSPTRAVGVWFGALAGAAWLGEIWTQAPARLPGPLERTVPALFALSAALLTVAAGVVAGVCWRRWRSALEVGLWTGLVSGALMTAGLVTIQLSNLGLLGARADYQRELARSGGTDMATYLAGDAVAASLAHMVINVLLGVVGAGIGVLVAASTATRTAG